MRWTGTDVAITRKGPAELTADRRTADRRTAVQDHRGFSVVLYDKAAQQKRRTNKIGIDSVAKGVGRLEVSIRSGPGMKLLTALLPEIPSGSRGSTHENASPAWPVAWLHADTKAAAVPRYLDYEQLHRVVQTFALSLDKGRRPRSLFKQADMAKVEDLVRRASMDPTALRRSRLWARLPSGQREYIRQRAFILAKADFLDGETLAELCWPDRSHRPRFRYQVPHSC